MTWIKAAPLHLADDGVRNGGLAMSKAAVETGVAVEERLAENARMLGWLVDAANDFETIGAEAAAELGL